MWKHPKPSRKCKRESNHTAAHLNSGPCPVRAPAFGPAAHFCSTRSHSCASSTSCACSCSKIPLVEGLLESASRAHTQHRLLRAGPPWHAEVEPLPLPVVALLPVRVLLLNVQHVHRCVRLAVRDPHHEKKGPVLGGTIAPPKDAGARLKHGVVIVAGARRARLDRRGAASGHHFERGGGSPKGGS